MCGTIYTASKKKNSEHGGFSFGDTHVALLVSRPDLPVGVVKTPVATSQVAPTILQALGIDPGALRSAQIEHTRILPGWAWDNIPTRNINDHQESADGSGGLLPTGQPLKGRV